MKAFHKGIASFLCSILNVTDCFLQKLYQMIVVLSSLMLFHAKLILMAVRSLFALSYELNFVSSHAHVVNRLLRENRKSIPKFLNC